MRYLALFLLLLLLASCKKEKSEFILEKTFGSGSAFDTEIASDSTYITVGISDSNPLFIKTKSGSGIDINYSSDIEGCFTEVIEESNSFILGGYSDGNILLSSIDMEGDELWDTIIVVSTDVRTVQISEYDTQTYMLIGSDHPDSLGSVSYVVALFDIDGDVLELNEVTPGYYYSLTDLEVLSPSEIYVSITKNSGGVNSKASVARLTPEGAIIWETELYNNKDFGAGSMSIEEDGGSLYVSGRTEYNGSEGLVSNSFLASLSLNGSVAWKKYLENSNVGSDIAFDTNMNLVMLNQNCFIVTNITLPDGANIDQYRVFDVCDSYNTKALGRSVSVTYEDNYLIAGSKDNKFYYALKSGNSN